MQIEELDLIQVLLKISNENHITHKFTKQLQCQVNNITLEDITLPEIEINQIEDEKG